MYRIKFITSILMMLVYIAPISLEAGDFFTHINQCEEEITCCSQEEEVVIVEENCCAEESISDHNECSSSSINVSEHIDDCSDSIICKCCLDSCTFQNINASNVGVNITLSQNVKLVRTTIISHQSIEEDSIDDKVDFIIENHDDIKIRKSLLESISIQYFSSNLI